MDLEQLWKQYSSLLKSTFKNEYSACILLEALGERMILTPSSRFVHDPGCEPGGMIKISLKVAQQAVKLMEAYDIPLEMKKSIVKIALLHDIGKVGDLEHNWLVPQDSDWHREKQGAHYKFNEAEGQQRMSVTHRTLYLLQHFGMQLTREEWIAIQLSNGFHFEENRFYVNGEPDLATIIQQAKYYVSKRRA